MVAGNCSNSPDLMKQQQQRREIDSVRGYGCMDGIRYLTYKDVKMCNWETSFFKACHFLYHLSFLTTRK